MTIPTNLSVKIQQTGRLIPVKASVGGGSSIEDLSNVTQPAAAETNSTLVFDSETQIYTVKKLDLDGGSF